MNAAFQYITYAAILGNVFFAAFVAATPADHPLPWWALAGFAGFNAVVHALPSSGLPIAPPASGSPPNAKPS